MSQTVSAQQTSSELPDFDNPPVVEVVMGVQFHPLESLLAPHLGLFWESVRSEYPDCSDNVPIAPQIEDLQRPAGLRDMRLEFTRVPPIPRVFFERRNGPWLMQVQRDRFLHNWRQSTSADAYPRYPAVRERFFAQWANFRQFVATHELGAIRIAQVEITYLNHIFPWSSGSNIGGVFPDFSWRQGTRALATPEACTVSCTFTAPDNRTRLRATARPGIHREKGEILLFELTVRGTAEQEDLESWFDAGRRWIVTAFADLTSEEWQKKWGRTR